MVETIREHTETVSSGKEPIRNTMVCSIRCREGAGINYKIMQKSVDAIARNSTQPPLVVLEAKSLVSKRCSLNIVLVCIAWNNILYRVIKALQAPGNEIGSVVMHYRDLLEHILSLRDSKRFNRFENEAKSVALGLDYDDENKRAKKRKLFHDETLEEVKVSDCRENFRVNTCLVIIDRLLSEIKKRNAAYTNVYERFGEIRSLADSDITSKCEELTRYYDNDIEPDF